jgi:hypothetical protein
VRDRNVLVVLVGAEGSLRGRRLDSEGMVRSRELQVNTLCGVPS